MNHKEIYGRIKVGTSCYQDFHFFRWPNTPGGRADPSTRFRFVILSKNRLLATADGFGHGVTGQPSGHYGNGRITVFPPRSLP